MFFPRFGSPFRANHPALFSTPSCFFFTFSASDTSFDEPCPPSSGKHAGLLTDQRPFLFSLANRALLSALSSSLRISWVGLSHRSRRGIVLHHKRKHGGMGSRPSGKACTGCRRGLPQTSSA